MIKDLAVDCGTIRVRTRDTSITPPPTISPIFVALGAVSIFGFLLMAASTGTSIPLTTGKLGGKMVAVKLGTTK